MTLPDVRNGQRTRRGPVPPCQPGPAPSVCTLIATGGHSWPPPTELGASPAGPVHLRQQDQRTGARKVRSYSKDLDRLATGG
jgi:hypothetical protein